MKHTTTGKGLARMSYGAAVALPGLGTIALLAGALGLASFGFVGCSSSECSGGACAAVDAESDEDSGPVCLPDADPKDDPACLDDAFGVFVDKEGGNDANPGTKGAPVQSIGVALGKLEGKKRVYVCEGNYFEHVTLTKPVSVHGGFACSTWSYTGAKARLAPNDSGYILQVALVTEPVVVTDLALEAVNGTASGASSVGAFITRSSSVTLRRMSISAGIGGAGADATDASDYVPASAPDGYAGDDAGQPGKGRQNPGCTASVGGAGARDGATPARSGQVSITPAFPESNSGTGGKSGVACAAGGNGIDGSYGVAGVAGAGAASFGALDTTGWKPTDGALGGRGGDGQGGGGGGQIAGLGIGGGGGPGGCGGAGGERGSAGGSSIALLVFDSAVTVESSSLVAKGGGNGGNGGKGQKAQLGSASASGPSLVTEACRGGLGGVGGSGGGGGGGGGAGGLSVGILYKGPAPIIDGASTPTAETLGSVTLGAPGVGGAKGIGGDAAQTTAPASKPGADGTAGIDGVAKAVVSVP